MLTWRWGGGQGRRGWGAEGLAPLGWEAVCCHHMVPPNRGFPKNGLGVTPIVKKPTHREGGPRGVAPSTPELMKKDQGAK